MDPSGYCWTYVLGWRRATGVTNEKPIIKDTKMGPQRENTMGRLEANKYNVI